MSMIISGIYAILAIITTYYLATAEGNLSTIIMNIMCVSCSIFASMMFAYIAGRESME
jgi:hypothetical protein